MVQFKAIAGAAGALVAGTVAAQAGGIERSAFNPGFLFEKGNWAEFSLGHVSPDVSGVQVIPTPPGLGGLGGSSGDMAGDYTTVSGAVKFQLNDQWALGIVVDQPIGADVFYGNAGYIYGAGAGGSQAEVNAVGVTVLAHYRLNERMSIYGGIKGEAVEGQVALFNGYRMSTDRALDYGFVVGAAYEIPDIALRVALTYTSDITHAFQATEVVPGVGTFATTFSSTVPQSLALDFQSGIAKDTLLFGSIRWRDWSEFQIAPALFSAANGPLVSYDNDSVTYTLGVGRRFSETWSGAVFVSHEPAGGGFAGNLGPTDGFTSIGLGATYTQDRMKITGGITYARIGDAVTEAPAALGAPAGTTLGRFTGNSLVGVGVKVGWSF